MHPSAHPGEQLVGDGIAVPGHIGRADPVASELNPVADMGVGPGKRGQKWGQVLHCDILVPQGKGARFEFLPRYSEQTRIHTEFEPALGERAIEGNQAITVIGSDCQMQCVASPKTAGVLVRQTGRRSKIHAAD